MRNCAAEGLRFPPPVHTGHPSLWSLHETLGW
jgi:hypothetical protein